MYLCLCSSAFATFGVTCSLGLTGALECGLAGALEMAARQCWGVRNGRSSPLGFAGAVEIAAQACSASLGRSNRMLEPTAILKATSSAMAAFSSALGAPKLARATMSSALGAPKLAEAQFRALWRHQGKPERPFPAPWQQWGGPRAAISSALAAPGQARAHISSALAAPGQARAAISSALAALGQAPAAISSALAALGQADRLSRAPSRSGALNTSIFKPEGLNKGRCRFTTLSVCYGPTGTIKYKLLLQLLKSWIATIRQLHKLNKLHDLRSAWSIAVQHYKQLPNPILKVKARGIMSNIITLLLDMNWKPITYNCW